MSGANQKALRTLTLLLCALTASAHSAVAQTPSSIPYQTISEPVGTVAPPLVRLRLLQTISSASARVGQVVPLEVVEPVQVDGKLVIAAGAPAQASVTLARHRGHNRREGKLLLTIQSVSRVDSRQARLQSASLAKGGAGGLPVFGPCTFPLPADPVGLFRKGNDVVIPKGTEITAALQPGIS